MLFLPLFLAWHTKTSSIHLIVKFHVFSRFHLKNRSEFVISTTDIKEEGLTIDSELDISMVSIEDDPALEFIDIKLLGKIRRINKSEYIFEA